MGQIERNYYYGQWHYIQCAWKYKHDHKQKKVGITMNFLTDSGSKMVDEVGEIPGVGQKIYP